jgi:hypothetical protein
MKNVALLFLGSVFGLAVVAACTSDSPPPTDALDGSATGGAAGVDGSAAGAGGSAAGAGGSAAGAAGSAAGAGGSAAGAAGSAAGAGGSAAGAAGSAAGAGGSAAGAAGSAAGAAGSAAGTGGVGGQTAFCASACAKAAAAACPNDENQTACAVDCTADAAKIPGKCAATYMRLGSCTTSTGTFSCDSQGKSQLSGCDTEAKGFAVCMACEPDATDQPCDTCAKSHCCTELKQNASSPDELPNFLQCMSACPTNDEVCKNNCVMQYSTAAALMVCKLDTACAAECN